VEVTTTPAIPAVSMIPAAAVAVATHSLTDAFTIHATSYQHGGSWRGVGGCSSTVASRFSGQQTQSLIATTLVAPVAPMNAAAAASKRRMVNKNGKGSSPWRFPV
jgi:hypothetical protein